MEKVKELLEVAEVALEAGRLLQLSLMEMENGNFVESQKKFLEAKPVLHTLIGDSCVPFKIEGVLDNEEYDEETTMQLVLFLNNLAKTAINLVAVKVDNVADSVLEKVFNKLCVLINTVENLFNILFD